MQPLSHGKLPSHGRL